MIFTSIYRLIMNFNIETIVNKIPKSVIFILVIASAANEPV